MGKILCANAIVFSIDWLRLGRLPSACALNTPPAAAKRMKINPVIRTTVI